MYKRFELHEGTFSALNTEITAMPSFISEQMVILKKSSPPISDTYSEQNFQYINVLLEQIHHLHQEKENETSNIQALNEKQSDLENITKWTQKTGTMTLRKRITSTKNAYALLQTTLTQILTNYSNHLMNSQFIKPHDRSL